MLSKAFNEVPKVKTTSIVKKGHERLVGEMDFGHLAASRADRTETNPAHLKPQRVIVHDTES